MQKFFVIAALALASPAHAFEAVTALPMHPYANALAQAAAGADYGCEIDAPQPGEPLHNAAMDETKALSLKEFSDLVELGYSIAVSAIEADISNCASIGRNIRARTAVAKQEGF